MRHRLALIAAGCLMLAAHADAQTESQSPSPELRLPSFDDLRGQATNAVNFTLGPLPFSVLGSLIGDHDAGSAQARAVLHGLQTLAVRHYEFASSFVYSKADLEAVRAQLRQPGWSQIVHVHDDRKLENVDVYLAVDKDRITGLTIVASEPREFTIVNAVGSLSMDAVNALRQRFDGDHAAVATAHGPSWPL